MGSMKVGVVGCGMISDWYFKAATRFKQIDIVACSDLKQELAEKQGKEYGIPVCTPDEIYASKEIQVVLNLTPPKAHYFVAKASLEAGKHTYSEKPLGIELCQGRELLDLAKAKKLYVGCAPDTFLGGGHQTARKLVDDGWIGKVVAGTAAYFGRGPENWVHAPAFYDKGAGPILDYAPYFVTQMINLFGPAVAVTASVTKGVDHRVGVEGTNPRVFPVNIPTHQVGVIEFANGTQMTLIGSYEAYKTMHETGIELYGSEGTLWMHNANFFGGDVKLFKPGYEDWRLIPPSHIYNTDARSVGLADMIYSIQHNKPSRASGEMAFHVLEIMLGLEKSSREQRRIAIESTCARPEPMPIGLRDGEVAVNEHAMDYSR